MSITEIKEINGLAFKGRNGYAKLDHVVVIDLGADCTTHLNLYSKRAANAAPAKIVGPKSEIIDLLSRILYELKDTDVD